MNTLKDLFLFKNFFLAPDLQPEELLRQGERRRHVVPPEGPQRLRRRPHPEGHPGREDRRGPSSLFLSLSLTGIVFI